MLFFIIFAILLVLFVLLLIVNSESISTIFNDTSSAFIAKVITIIIIIGLAYSWFGNN